MQASSLPLHLPDLWFGPMQGSRSGKAIWSGIRWRYPSASTAAHARAMTARSQFWSQLPPFVGVPECSTARLAGVNRRRRTLLNLGLRIWKAGWVQALAGSSPASSSGWKHALTWGNAVRATSFWDGVASTTESASLSSGLSFRPPVCGNPSLRRPGGVRRRAPCLTQPATNAD